MMKKSHSFYLIVLLFSFTATTFSQIDIILRKSFVDTLKDRISYTLDYIVVKMHYHPNSPSADGDMHIAGYSNRVGLPIVAEIMNAKYQGEAIDILRSFEGTSNMVQMKGAWRIWCEHSGNDKQEQGVEIPQIINTNPAHVFEIHPITNVADKEILNSLTPIVGYQYKVSDDAFDKYSHTFCKLEDLGEKVLIETRGVGYNYAEFWIEVTDSSQFITSDGRFLFCRILDKEGKIIVHKMRLAFPKDSEAELKVKDLNKGDKMHVIGIPRINLALISYRIKHSNESPYMLEWNLPVEMIIVATFDN